MAILNKLHEIKELPTLPEIILKVQAFIHSDEANASSLSKIIVQDPALSSTILKTANSAFYNTANRKIASITDAIIRIGFNEVLKIAIAMSVIQQFSNTKSVIGYHSFWRHSLTAAGMAVVIGKMSKNDALEKQKEYLYLSGLLHDIGVLIHDQFFHDSFTKIIDHAMEQGQTYLEAESAVSSKETHPFIGGVLLEMWKIALPVIGAVRFHHNPNKCPEKLREIVAVIALTEYILCNSFLGSFEGPFHTIDESVWTITGISPNSKKSLCVQAEAEAGKTDILLSMGADRSMFESMRNSSDTRQFKLRHI